MAKRLYIGVEVVSRELHAKLLLACIAAERGYTAVIGRSTEVRDSVRTWRPGLIVWKGLVSKGARNYKLFHKLGHDVVAWCEEGLVYPSSEFYKRLRVSSEALRELDLFFAWGHKQAKDILAKVPNHEHKIVLAGNPRVSLLEKRFRGIFESEVEEIKAQHAPYILINTNFGSFTHPLGPEGVINRLRKKGTISNAREEEFYLGRAKNREKLLTQFTQMLAALETSVDGVNIVLRPHPSESLELWKSNVHDLTRTRVIRKGSAIPWIIGSEMMIHNDCTTAVEAHLLGKPVISFRPTAGNPYESKLPIAVSYAATNINDLIALANEVIRGEADKSKVLEPKSAEIMKEHLATYENGSSCEIIMDNIERFHELQRLEKRTIPFWKRRIRSAATRYRYRFNKARKVLQRQSKNVEAYGLHDEGTGMLSLDEIREIVGQLSVHSGRFRNLDVKPLLGTNTCYKIVAI